MQPRPIHISTVSLNELPIAFEVLRPQARKCKVLIRP